MPKDSAIADWTCPTCSAEVQKGDKFCRHCGVQFDWALSARPSSGDLNLSNGQEEVESSASSPSGAEGETSSGAKEGSAAGTIFLFVVIALVVFLFLSAGSRQNDVSSSTPSGTSQEASSESQQYQERIAPHIITGYAWNDFRIFSGIQGGGSISDFSRELYDYLNGISPISRSGIEISMNPGNALSNLLYAIIEDETTINLIYTWLLNHAPA